MRRKEKNQMKGIHQNTNADPTIMKKSIALVEILDGRNDPQEMNLHLLKRIQVTTIGQHQPQDLDLEGMSARDVIDLGHVVTQDQEGVEGTTHLTREGDKSFFGHVGTSTGSPQMYPGGSMTLKS